MSDFTCNQNHAFPQPRQARSTKKAVEIKTLLNEKTCQRGTAPELYVAAMPESCMVMIPLS